MSVGGKKPLDRWVFKKTKTKNIPAGDCWMMDPTPLQNSSNVNVPSPSGSNERSASAKSYVQDLKINTGC